MPTLVLFCGGPLLQSCSSQLSLTDSKKREEIHYPFLNHPLSSYPDYSELSSNLLKWKLQSAKIVVGAVDQEASYRLWLNHSRKRVVRSEGDNVLCHKYSRIQHSCPFSTMGRL